MLTFMKCFFPIQKKAKGKRNYRTAVFIQVEDKKKSKTTN